MVKKNNFIESLNLFSNKSGKKSYNGILIIAGILGILVLSGLVVGWADDNSAQNSGTIHVYNSTDSLNVFATNPNLTAANEGVQFYFFANLSNREVAEDELGTAQTNITNVTFQFDQNWVIVRYNFTKSDIQQAGELLAGGNTTDGNQKGSFDNRTVAGYHNFTWGANNLINATASNGTFSFSAIIDVPGTYNISIRFGNATATGGVNVNNVTYIYIEDATAPNNVTAYSNTTGFSSISPVYRTFPTTSANVSHNADLYSAQNIYVSLGAYDLYETGISGFGYKGQEIGGINFTLYNSTGIVNSTLMNKRAGINNSFAVNFTSHAGGVNLSDDNYYINITTVNDSKGNINYTGLGFNITLDRTKPTVSLAKASSSTKSQIVVDITVSDAKSGIAGKQCTASGGGTGGITLSGTGGTQTATQTGLGCGTSYTYTIVCNDHAGNSQSTSASINTDNCDGGSSGTSGTGTSGTSGSDVVGSASSSFWVLTYNEASTELSENSDGVSVNLAEKYRAKVKVNTKLYYVGVVDTTDTTAKINVTTTAEDKEATFSVGDVKKFDVNADDKYDLSVTLNGIDSATGKADLSVVYIQEPVPAEEQAGVEEQAGTEATTPAKSKAWIWIVVVLAVIVIVGAIFYSKKKTRFKNYGF